MQTPVGVVHCKLGEVTANAGGSDPEQQSPFPATVSGPALGSQR